MAYMYGVISSKANWRSMGSDGTLLTLQMRKSLMNGLSSSWRQHLASKARQIDGQGT